MHRNHVNIQIWTLAQNNQNSVYWQLLVQQMDVNILHNYGRLQKDT